MIKYVVFSRFNHIHRTLDDPRTRRCMLNPKWWEKRVKLFNKFTLKSLEQQTFKDFEIWTPVSPYADRGGAQHLLKSAREKGFHIFYDVAENKTKFSKPYTEAIKKHKGVDYLVFINLDSDDVYAANAIEKIASYEPEPGLVLIFQDGYIYDPRIDRLAEYRMDNSPPPFFAMFYTKRALKNERRFLEYEDEWKMDGFHYEMLGAKNHKLIGNGYYSYIVHGSNTSTAWQKPETVRHVGENLEGEEKQKIKKLLGL